MNCPPTGSESGLVGYWNFEEGSGTTAYDQTANGNDGTINGATYDTNVPSQSCALTNANGCDSTAVLNLTINNSVTTQILYQFVLGIVLQLEQVHIILMVLILMS